MNLLDFLSEENRQKNTRWLDEKSNQFNQFMNRFFPRNPNDKGHMAQFPIGLMETISPATDVVDAQSSSEGLMNELSRGSKINALGQGARMVASLGSLALPGNLVRTYDDLSKNIVANYEKFKNLKVDPYRSKKRVWHASPHDFDEFKINDDTIGGGEGNQAYGWGGYSSQDRGIPEDDYLPRLAGVKFTYKGKEMDEIYDAVDQFEDMGLLKELGMDDWFTGKLDFPDEFNVNYNNIKRWWQSQTQNPMFKPDFNKEINYAFGKHSEKLQETIDLLTDPKHKETFVPDFILGREKDRFDDIAKNEGEPLFLKNKEKDDVARNLSILNDPSIAKILFGTEYDLDPRYFGNESKYKIFDKINGNEEKIVERLEELKANLSKMNPEDFQVKSKGKLYEMDFDAEFYELLDWDKPMSQQSDFVKERIGKIVDNFTLDDTKNLGIDFYDIHQQLRNTNYKKILNNILSEGKTKEEAYKIIDDMFPNGILAHKAEQEMQFDVGGMGFAPYTNPNYLKAKDVDKIFEINEEVKKIDKNFTGLEWVETVDNFVEKEFLPIAKNYAKKSLLSSDAEVSMFLNDMNYMKGKHNAGELASRDLGIKGIMYNAGGSRRADMNEEDRIKNFVTFNDRDLEIIKKYGLLASPIIAGVGLLGNDNDRPN